MHYLALPIFALLVHDLTLVSIDVCIGLWFSILDIFLFVEITKNKLFFVQSTSNARNSYPNAN